MHEENPLSHLELVVQAHDVDTRSRRRPLWVALGSAMAMGLTSITACSPAPQAPAGWELSPATTQSGDAPANSKTANPASAPAQKTQPPTVQAEGNRYVGLDTSVWSLKGGKLMDADQMVADGFAFQLARATSGLKADPTYLPSAANAQKAHILFGSYCVPEHDKPMKKQAEFCASLVDKGTPNTPGVGPQLIAVSAEAHDKFPKTNLTKDDVYTFMEDLDKLIPGREKFIYTLRQYWGTKDNGYNLGNPKLPPGWHLWWAKNQFTPELEQEVKTQMEQNQKNGDFDKPPVLKPKLTKDDFEHGNPRMKNNPWIIASHVARPVKSGYSTTDLFPVYKTGQVNNYDIRQFTTQAFSQGRRHGVDITFPTTWPEFLKLAGVNNSTDFPEPKKHL